MEVKRDGLVISIMHLDEGTKSGLVASLNAFITVDKADLRVNVWDMGKYYTVDIYCEAEIVIRRLEEYLNSEGYVLRLTPKKIIV